MANRYDLRISQRTDYSLKFLYRQDDGTTVIPLTGATAKAQIRQQPGATELLAEFDISINGTEGSITIGLDETDTATLPVGRSAWDLLLTMDGETEVFLEGRVLVDGTVTV